MANLSRDEILKVANLARLDLTPEEVEIFQKRLGRVLDYMNELKEVETSKDAFVRHVPKDAVGLRADAAVPFGSPEQILSNAPSVEDHHFLLPTIVEHT